MKKKNRDTKKAREKFSIKKVITTKLPAAIESDINSLFAVGFITMLLGIFMLFNPSLRGITPMAMGLGALITIYAFWKKADVLSKGYDEYIFKVVDYTFIAPVLTKLRSPTGLLLLKKDEEGTESGNIYHVAVSGKGKNLPPVDWLIRVYVPKGSTAAQYGDRKYFPTVYGYRIEGEDKPDTYRHNGEQI